MISPWLISELASSVESIKFPKLRKNRDFREKFQRNIWKKSKPLGLGSDVFCFCPISFNTSILSVLKNRTSKNGTPETLDHPLKLKYFDFFFKNFGEIGINFLILLKDFGYHNLPWKRRFNSEIFGFLTAVVNGVMMTGRVTKWIYEVIIDKMEFVKMSP